jgi:hypothetical protein
MLVTPSSSIPTFGSPNAPHRARSRICVRRCREGPASGRCGRVGPFVSKLKKRLSIGGRAPECEPAWSVYLGGLGRFRAPAPTSRALGTDSVLLRAGRPPHAPDPSYSGRGCVHLGIGVRNWFAIRFGIGSGPPTFGSPELRTISQGFPWPGRTRLSRCRARLDCVKLLTTGGRASQPTALPRRRRNVGTVVHT